MGNVDNLAGNGTLLARYGVTAEIGEVPVMTENGKCEVQTVPIRLNTGNENCQTADLECLDFTRATLRPPDNFCGLGGGGVHRPLSN